MDPMDANLHVQSIGKKKNFRITSLLHDPDAFLIRIVADAPKKKASCRAGADQQKLKITSQFASLQKLANRGELDRYW